MKHSYKVFGWVTTEICVEAGVVETKMSLKEIYDIVSQIFIYPEGIFIRRIK